MLRSWWSVCHGIPWSISTGITGQINPESGGQYHRNLQIEAYPDQEDLPGSKGISNPLFDSVIVVTDRKLLDKQLRENIKEFSEVKNIVAPAYSSADLKKSLETGKKIIITTIQKFPFIIEGIADLSNKRFAVIIDEAHSSQSGSAAGKMNQAMGGGTKPLKILYFW